MFYEIDSKLYYSYDNETVCVEAWGRNALRVRATANREFTANDWALTEPVCGNAPKVEIFIDSKPAGSGMLNMYAGGNKSYAKITNGKITATLNTDGVITFTNDKKKILSADIHLFADHCKGKLLFVLRHNDIDRK